MELIAELVAWVMVVTILGLPAVVLGNCIYEKIRQK